MGRQRKSNNRGYALAEYGPALWLVFICFFFPMLDLLCTTIEYGMCAVLNTNQAHEASLIPKSQASDPNGTIKKGIPDQWQQGMGAFVRTQGPIVTDISYRPGAQSQDSGNNSIQDMFVRVGTSVTCTPVVSVWLPGISAPGLNAPITFNFASDRQMENPDDANN